MVIAYGLRVGGEEAADVPGVFGQGCAPREGRPDPRSGLPLPFCQASEYPTAQYIEREHTSKDQELGTSTILTILAVA